MPVVTLLDTLRIQAYVFASSRLRDAVGGSNLVDRLGRWAATVCPPNDVLIAAGGNAWLRFPDESAARSALSRLSRQAFEEAPGLELVAVHHPYQPGGLVAAVEAAQQSLARAKLARSPSVPLLGLSVTAPCRETRGPATDFNEDGQPIAADVVARRKALNSDRWTDFLPPPTPERKYEFPVEVERLGRTRGERSLLGVVHIDGNGVGRKLGAWMKDQAAARREDEAFADDLRKVSAGLQDLGRSAFAAVVQQVLSADANRTDLPLRPLILGGDDLTFVCDGRIALDLTATALSVFERSNLPVLGKVHACAGVAIVPVRAPLLRGYELAGNLCDEAKRWVRESGQDQCALDWHIGFAGTVESLSEIRRRQYRAGSFNLTSRPYPLERWHWLSKSVLKEGLCGPVWSERRNKVKALRDLLRDGPDAVRRAMHAWRVAAPDLSLPAGLEASGGFEGDRTPLLDAIELLDIHEPLEGAIP